MYGLEFNEQVSRNRTFAAKVRDKKLQLIQEAISWSGNKEKGSFVLHDIWESDDKRYKVSLGKFGKEYYLDTIKWKDGHLGNNPNDMHPTVFVNGVEKEFDGSFDHVFNFFQDVSKVSEEALRILGCIIYRNSLLVDHIRDNKGYYRFSPSKEAMDIVTSFFPTYDGISTEAYIHYLEAIAWNEDVKYYTLGHDVFGQGTGRTNNMKTYAHIIAVLLGKASLSKLCSSFARPPVGVSPIPTTTAASVFPELNLI